MERLQKILNKYHDNWTIIGDEVNISIYNKTEEDIIVIFFGFGKSINKRFIEEFEILCREFDFSSHLFITSMKEFKKFNDKYNPERKVTEDRISMIIGVIVIIWTLLKLLGVL